MEQVNNERMDDCNDTEKPTVYQDDKYKNFIKSSSGQIHEEIHSGDGNLSRLWRQE